MSVHSYLQMNASEDRYYWIDTWSPRALTNSSTKQVATLGGLCGGGRASGPAGKVHRAPCCCDSSRQPSVRPGVVAGIN